MKAKWLIGCLAGLLLGAGSAMAVPEVLATDDAGNYTLTTFTNQSTAGSGFGVWDLWGEPATLGDSTAGGGGDLNSTNGYSFRFMGDGADGWCNGSRNLSGSLETDDVLSFTFTYNWDGGGRGVDLFGASGQIANLIHVSGGNSFSVNGTEISTDYSPSAVVAVEITQLTNGVQVYLTRETNGVENLSYTTNILSAEPANKFGLYCGGYTCDPGDNVNYAIFMNDIEVMGEPRTSLNFTDGTYDPDAIGNYTYTLVREGAVDDDIVLSSTDTNVLTVPTNAMFDTGIDTLVITASVVSVTSGPATIIASNVTSGMWAEYNVTPVGPMLIFTAGTWNPDTPDNYTYLLERTATVGDDIVLSSTDTNVLTVPTNAVFMTGSNMVMITAAVVSVSSGPATIIASNVASGAWAEYNVTPVPPTLSFTDGTYDPATPGMYTYTLMRTGTVSDAVLFTSSDTNVLTVPSGMDFEPAASTLIFTATVVDVSSGPATIIATNPMSGAWAEYVVTPVAVQPAIGSLTFDVGTGDITFEVPDGYSLTKVEAADNALVAGDWVWTLLVQDTDYSLSPGLDMVTILCDQAARRVIRVWIEPTI